MSGINIGNGRIWDDEGHITTFAPTRSGKGYYLVNAALTDDCLKDHDAPSFVVLDLKGENIMISGNYLKKAGYQVICINPYDIPGLEEFGKGSFNPLQNIDPFCDDIDEIIDTIAYSIIPQSDHKNKYFDEAGRDFIVNCLRHLLTQTEDEISFRTLYFYLLSEGNQLDDLLRKMVKNPNFDKVIAKYALSVASQKGTDSWKSVSSTARTSMTIFGRKRLSQSLAGSDFKISDLNTKKIAVFLCMPKDTVEKSGAWIRIFFATILRELMKDYTPIRRVVALLDEFPKLGYLKEAEDFFTIGAHYATLWAIIQDIPQLKRIYDGWESIIANSKIIHWFGANDNTTAEYISKRMPMTIKFLGTNPDGSQKFIEKPFLRPDEVTRVQDIILDVAGAPAPKLIKKIPYLEQNRNGRNLRG